MTLAARWFASLVLALPVTLATADAQSARANTPRPDFAGSWVLDAAKSTGEGPPAFTVTVTPKTLTMVPPQAGAPTFVFNLDGSEAPGPGRGGPTLKATWRGDKLDTTMTSGRGSMTITWSREGEYLIHEGAIGRGGSAAKLYYKRAAK